MIATNRKEGVLSNDSLRESVLLKIKDHGDYEDFFQPVKSYQDDDGIYDADELGVSSLASVLANC